MSVDIRSKLEIEAVLAMSHDVLLGRRTNWIQYDERMAEVTAEIARLEAIYQGTLSAARSLIRFAGAESKEETGLPSILSDGRNGTMLHQTVTADPLPTHIYDHTAKHHGMEPWQLRYVRVSEESERLFARRNRAAQLFGASAVHGPAVFERGMLKIVESRDHDGKDVTQRLTLPVQASIPLEVGSSFPRLDTFRTALQSVASQNYFDLVSGRPDVLGFMMDNIVFGVDAVPFEESGASRLLVPQE